jgi:hypothetical protein
MAFFKVSKNKFIEIEFLKVFQNLKHSILVHRTHLEIDNFFNKDQKFGFHFVWIVFGILILDIKLYDMSYLTESESSQRKELEPLAISSDAFRVKDYLTISILDNYLSNLYPREDHTALNNNEERTIYWTYPSIINPIWSKAFIQYKNDKGEYFIKEA